jgi:hypothetical protein
LQETFGIFRGILGLLAFFLGALPQTEPLAGAGGWGWGYCDRGDGGQEKGIKAEAVNQELHKYSLANFL